MRGNSSSEITNRSHLLLGLLIDNKVCHNCFAMSAPIRMHTCMARSGSVLVPASVSPLRHSWTRVVRQRIEREITTDVMLQTALYILYIHYTYILYIHYTYRTYTIHTYCTYTIHTYCTYTMHTYCTYTIHTVHTLYIHTVHTLYIPYIHYTYILYIHYTYILYYTYTMHTYCTYTIQYCTHVQSYMETPQAHLAQIAQSHCSEGHHQTLQGPNASSSHSTPHPLP